MKQEMKEILGYLPYGVKANLNRNKGMFKSDNVDLRMCKLSYNNTVDEYYFTYKNVTYGIEDIKLILRPLSDLNKEITVNGETFVPIKKLGTRFSSIKCLLYKHTVQLDTNDLSSVNLIHYLSVFNKLYSMHFDIHNLIEQGKAINLNDLKV